MQIVSKLPEVGTTIFSVMSALAKEHGAINLSQGFPDYGLRRDALRPGARSSGLSAGYDRAA